MPGSKGRVIGLVAGGAIAATAAGVLSHGIDERSGWLEFGVRGAAAGVGAAAVGIGYLTGWLIDTARARPEVELRILPDGD